MAAPIGAPPLPHTYPNQQSSNTLSRSELQKLADSGDAEARFAFAQQCEDLVERARYYQLAADQGLTKAQAMIGYCLYKGLGVDKDIHKAQIYLQYAAWLDVDAQMHLGNLLLETPDISNNLNTGLYYLKLAADHTESKAVHKHQYAAAALKYIADTAILRTAIEHYLFPALNQEYVPAYSTFVSCLYKGFCDIEDKEAGLNYLKKGAAEGDAQTLFEVAECLFKGKGCDKHETLALDYLRAAAEKGNARAEAQIEAIFLKTKEQADQGIANACYMVSKFYAKGIGVQKQPEQNIVYLIRSAESGYLKAQIVLGVRYIFGREIEQDVVKGADYLRQALLQNHDATSPTVGPLLSALNQEITALKEQVQAGSDLRDKLVKFQQAFSILNAAYSQR